MIFTTAGLKYIHIKPKKWQDPVSEASPRRSTVEGDHQLALHEIPQGARYFSLQISARVFCFTGGKVWEAASSITIAPKCSTSLNRQRAGTPRYRHCCTVRNFAPSERATRSISCLVRRIIRKGSIGFIWSKRARACDKVLIIIGDKNDDQRPGINWATYSPSCLEEGFLAASGPRHTAFQGVGTLNFSLGQSARHACHDGVAGSSDFYNFAQSTR